MGYLNLRSKTLFTVCMLNRIVGAGLPTWLVRPRLLVMAQRLLLLQKWVDAVYRLQVLMMHNSCEKWPRE